MDCKCLSTSTEDKGRLQLQVRALKKMMEKTNIYRIKEKTV